MNIEYARWRIYQAWVQNPEIRHALAQTPIITIGIAAALGRASEGAFRGSLRLMGKIYDLGKSS